MVHRGEYWGEVGTENAYITHKGTMIQAKSDPHFCRIRSASADQKKVSVALADHD